MSSNRSNTSPVNHDSIIRTLHGCCTFNVQERVGSLTARELRAPSNLTARLLLPGGKGQGEGHEAGDSGNRGSDSRSGQHGRGTGDRGAEAGSRGDGGAGHTIGRDDLARPNTC